MHSVQYISYPCKTTEKQILRELNTFAFDPEETDGYHGNLHFHRDIVCKDKAEAEDWIESHDRGWYDDHAVFYKDGRKKLWLVKVEWHC